MNFALRFEFNYAIFLDFFLKLFQAPRKAIVGKCTTLVFYSEPPAYYAWLVVGVLEESIAKCGMTS